MLKSVILEKTMRPLLRFNRKHFERVSKYIVISKTIRSRHRLQMSGRHIRGPLVTYTFSHSIDPARPWPRVHTN